MDELKLLVEMVAHLPAMALWVIAFFFAYKVICIGSIYGIIRFGVDRLHSWLMAPQTRTFKKIVDVEPRIRNMSITSGGVFDDLLLELSRIRGKGTSISSDYIHDVSVRWLREAIDAKEAADRLKKP